MTGIKVVNLKLMIEALGESRTKAILSSFSCPLNPDVENFIRYTAIEFAKQGIAATHLVVMQYKKEPVIVGYFSLANKYISVRPKKLTLKTKQRLERFAKHDEYLNQYTLACPLIGQLGKNFDSNYNDLLTGSQLLQIALTKVAEAQMNIGGKWAYVECEDKPQLVQFYGNNGFVEFSKRNLDKDETGIQGQYLIQMLKYIK